MKMSPDVQDALLQPLIFHYERSEITDEHFFHVGKAIVSCAPQGSHGKLVKSFIMCLAGAMVKPEDRPPGAPNSIPNMEGGE